MRENQNPVERTALMIQSPATTDSGLKLVYEVDNNFGHFVPRLRLTIDKDTDADTAVRDTYVTRTQS